MYVYLNLLLLFVFTSCSGTKYRPTPIKINVINSTAEDKSIKPGTLLKTQHQKFEVLEVYDDSYLLLETDVDDNKIVYEIKKDMSPRMKIIPNSKAYIYLANGIYGEVEYRDSTFIKPETLKYYWGKEKTIPLITNELSSARFPHFSKRFNGEQILNAKLGLKGFQSTSFLSDFAGLRNYKNLKGPKLSGIYKKGSDPTDIRNYISGSYLDEKGNLFIFGGEKKERAAGYKGQTLIDTALVLDNGEKALFYSIHAAQKIEKITIPHIASIQAEAGLRWFGSFNSNKKNGWWSLRKDIDSDILGLALYSNGKLLNQYRFENGHYDCSHLENLPNRNSFFSNNQSCQGVLIEKSLITDKIKDPKDYYHYWGNAVINQVKTKKNKIISGQVSTLYPYPLALGSLPVTKDREKWNAGFDKDYSRRYSGRYKKNGELYLTIKHVFAREQILFEGFVRNKIKNGAAICSLPKYPDFKKIPCFWENDQRIDAQYIKQQNDQKAWDQLDKCKNKAKEFAEIYYKIVKVKFIDGDKFLKQLDYSWKRDTSEKSLDCDTCYVESIDTTKAQLNFVAFRLKTLERVESQLPDLYEVITTNNCTKDNIDSYTGEILEKINQYRPYLKEH